MDLATIIGAVGGVSLLGWAVYLQGVYGIFLSLTSILIVGGGTLAGTMISFSL